jgi:hypothetical protein
MRESTPLYQQACEAIETALAAHGADRQLWIERALRLHRMALQQAPANECTGQDLWWSSSRNQPGAGGA